MSSDIYCSLKYNHLDRSDGFDNIAEPFFLKGNPDASINQLLLFASTVNFNSIRNIHSRDISFLLTLDFWYPLDSRLADNLYPLPLRVRVMKIEYELNRHLSVSIGKDKIPTGWQEPTEANSAVLPLLSGSGNLCAYYPQLKLNGNFTKYIDYQLYFLSLDGHYHDAAEYLESEYKWGWTPGGEHGYGGRINIRMTRNLSLGASVHKGDLSIEHTPSGTHDSYIYMLEWNAHIGKITFRGDMYRTESDQMFLGNAGYINESIEHAAYGGWMEIVNKFDDHLTLTTGIGGETIRTRDLLFPGDIQLRKTVFLGGKYQINNRLTFSSTLKTSLIDHKMSKNQRNHMMSLTLEYHSSTLRKR